MRYALYSTARDNGGLITAGEMQSTINQLKHGKGGAVHAIMVLGVVLIDHTARGVAECCMAISTTPLVPLLHVQHFLPCFN